jgi:AcrR family transcriptional regulator
VPGRINGIYAPAKETALGSRSQNKEDVRARLIETAMRLFEKQGFDSTTIEDIAREAGVSSRTCFRYFPTKLDLAFPFHKERLQWFKEELRRNFSAENPIEGVRLALLFVARDYQSRREEMLVEYNFVSASPALTAKDTELDREYESAVSETLMRGRLSEQEARVLAGTIFWSIKTAMGQWYIGQCKKDLLEVGQVTLRLMEWLSRTYSGHNSMFGRPDATAGQAANINSSGVVNA